MARKTTHKKFCDGHWTWHCWECRNAENWQTIPTDDDIRKAITENLQKAILDATGIAVTDEDLPDFILDTISDGRDDLIGEKYDENARNGLNKNVDEMRRAQLPSLGRQGRDQYAYCKYAHNGSGGYVCKIDVPNQGHAQNCGHYDYEPPKPRQRK